MSRLIMGEWFYGFILNLFLVFGIILLIIALTYIFIVYKNVKKRHELESKGEYWEEKLDKHSEGELDRRFWKKNIENRDEAFGNFLLEKVRKGDHDLGLLKDLYVDLDFVQEDIERLNSKKWYKKTKTLERWKKMDILAKENDVLHLLFSQNNAVRLAALDLLSHHKHPSIAKNVKSIIDFQSKNVDDYILVKLMNANISVENLRRLALSNDKRLKRTGVVLLGRRGEKDVVEILKRVKHENENIRYEIARSLGRIRRLEAVKLLEIMKQDDSPKVRKEVARSLGLIYQKDIVKDSRREPVRAPSEMDDSIKILEELVRDEEHEVRVVAFLALSNLEEEGREVINRYRDEYPSVAKEALLNSFSGGVRYYTL